MYEGQHHMISNFEFTLPEAPVAGDIVGIQHHVQGDYWDAYLRRNNTNGWDFRLDSIAQLNYIEVMDVGKPDAIKVISDGSLHDCYTRTEGIWTERGRWINDAPIRESLRADRGA
jgi:hypothetical protein